MAISIARKMNALIFLVPQDIVDVRPHLMCFVPPPSFRAVDLMELFFGTDFDVYWKLDEHRVIVRIEDVV